MPLPNWANASFNPFKRDDLVLVAEMSSRREQRASKKPPAEEDKDKQDPLPSTELRDVLRKTPENRLKWLQKVLLYLGGGKLRNQAIYDVIAHRRFGDGASAEVLRQMREHVLANLRHFSIKQQRFLQSEANPLNFAAKPADPEPESNPEDAERAVPPPPPAEESAALQAPVATGVPAGSSEPAAAAGAAGPREEKGAAAAAPQGEGADGGQEDVAKQSQELRDGVAAKSFLAAAMANAAKSAEGRQWINFSVAPSSAAARQRKPADAVAEDELVGQRLHPSSRARGGIYDPLLDATADSRGRQVRPTAPDQVYDPLAGELREPTRGEPSGSGAPPSPGTERARKEADARARSRSGSPRSPGAAALFDDRPGRAEYVPGHRYRAPCSYFPGNGATAQPLRPTLSYVPGRSASRSPHAGRSAPSGAPAVRGPDRGAQQRDGSRSSHRRGKRRKSRQRSSSSGSASSSSSSGPPRARREKQPKRAAAAARGGFDSQTRDKAAAGDVELATARLLAEQQLQKAFTGVFDARDMAALAAAQQMSEGVVPTAGAPFKSGDWLCPTCNAHNYRDKPRCFRCGASQPERRAAEHLAVLAAAGVPVTLGLKVPSAASAPGRRPTTAPEPANGVR